MNSRENMGALGSRIANMGQTLMQTAIRTGVAAGVSAAAAHIEEEHQKEAKERTDRRLHNTRLLLKNYRLLKRHTAGAIYNAKQAKEKESAASILDGLESYTRDDSLYIESIKRSFDFLLVERACVEQGLDSCAQECWAVYPKTISAFIGIPPERMLFTGMSIGWRNPEHPINALRSDRAAVDDFTTFHGG